MNIQSIQRMMAPTVLAILTVPFNNIVEGLARLGWGMVGIPYPEYFEKNPP
jgi:hypothetical protein